MKKSLGLIVNPVAGMGGRVGLKGTDGPALQAARALGAQPQSPARTVVALRGIAARLERAIEVFAAPGQMGADEALEAGLLPLKVGLPTPGPTTAVDTEMAAAALADLEVDLLLFAGGDGTARDIARAVGRRLPVLGIPAGVKMHSAVYATSPGAAADLAVAYLQAASLPCRDAEVMDIDEDAFREGLVSARLYGFLKVPYEKGLLQGLKSASHGGEEAALSGIARDVVERMSDGCLYVVGPGTTTRAIAERLGLPKTLLGVDLICQGEVLANDVNEAALLRSLGEREARIVVTPIGGQGYLFGRGNQQISAAIIRRVGRRNLLVVATPDKLASLGGQPLRVDTGDAEVDASLAGYVRVVTGYRSEAVYRVD